MRRDLGAAADAILSLAGHDPDAADESAFEGAVLVAAFLLTQLPPEKK
jgi:hypothetical protein